MEQTFDLVEGVQLEPIAILDIVLTAILIYGAFSLIQGTRAVRLIVGAILLYLLYVVAQVLDLRLLSGIMQLGAVVALFALVVVFQPELRRGLDRLGRVGSLGWLGASGSGGPQRVAGVVASSAASLAAANVGALIVVERETPLGDMAEQGVTVDGRLSQELLTSLFAHGAALHDGAVIVRGERIAAAAVTLPLSFDVPAQGRLGTRHRAAIGITEQTDALAIVVSEERGTITLVAGGTMSSELDAERLRDRLVELLDPEGVPERARRIALQGGRTLRGKPIRGTRRTRRTPPAGGVAGPTVATATPASTAMSTTAGAADTSAQGPAVPGSPPAQAPATGSAPPTASRSERSAPSTGPHGVTE
jgi:diadenylate cyclase